MAREVLKLFLRVDANNRGLIVRMPRRAEAIWDVWRTEADWPVVGGGRHRVRRRNFDSCGALCGLRRVHRGRRDGRSLLQAALAGRVLADHESRRTCGVVLLRVFVHRLGRLGNPKHRRADWKSETALRIRRQKAECRKEKAEG